MSDLNPYTPEFGRNPWPAYSRLRKQDLVWHERFGLWLVSHLADVTAIATDRRMVREPLFATPAERAAMQRAANFHDIPYHEVNMPDKLIVLGNIDRLRTKSGQGGSFR